MGKISSGEIKLKLKNILGESFILENPEDIKEGESWELPEDYLKQMQQAAHSISVNRGRVLTLAIGLEDDLDEIIKIILYGTKITDSSKLFEDLVLKTNFFSSMDKWKVFRELTKQFKLLKNSDYSNLLKRIHELINLRNRFAHGIIIFRSKKVFLSYYQGGRKEVELTEKYFEEIFSLFQETSSELSKVTSLLSES